MPRKIAALLFRPQFSLFEAWALLLTLQLFPAWGPLALGLFLGAVLVNRGVQWALK